MKRVFIALFLCVTFLSAFCQDINIEGCWGFKFGLHRKIVKIELEKRFPNKVVYEEGLGELSIYGSVSFAGYNFDAVRLMFYDELFYRANFSDHYDLDKYKEAKSVFDYLKEDLMRKYGSYHKHPHKEDANSITVGWSDSNFNSIILSICKSLSNGGEYFYYVTLDYTNDKLYELSKQKNYNDL